MREQDTCGAVVTYTCYKTYSCKAEVRQENNSCSSADKDTENRLSTIERIILFSLASAYSYRRQMLTSDLMNIT